LRPLTLGGFAILSGALLIGGALALGVVGMPVGLGLDHPVGRIVEAGLLLLALGGAILAVIGAPPWNGRLIRLALAVFATGLAIMTLTSHVPADDPLVFAFLAGALVAGVGVVLLAFGMLAKPGAPRRLAGVFGAGILAAVAGIAVQGLREDVPAEQLATLLLLVAISIVTAGLAAFGLLAMRSDRDGSNAIGADADAEA
jgi:hypothetical protein